MIRRNAQCTRRSQSARHLRRGDPRKFRSYGIKVWLRADMGVTLNGSTVSAWADQSGNGNDVSQGTGALQPTFNATDASLNGKPTMTFVGASSQQLLNTAQNPFVAGTARYVMMIAKKTTPENATMGSLACFRTGGAGGWALQAYRVGDGNTIYFTDNTSYNIIETNILLDFTVPFLIEHEITVGAVPVVRVNSSQRTLGAQTVTAAESSATGLCIGGRNFGAYWNGAFAEFLTMSIPVASAVRRLQHYAAARYGVAA